MQASFLSCYCTYLNKISTVYLLAVGKIAEVIMEANVSRVSNHLLSFFFKKKKKSLAASVADNQNDKVKVIFCEICLYQRFAFIVVLLNKGHLLTQLMFFSFFFK